MRLAPFAPFALLLLVAVTTAAAVENPVRSCSRGAAYWQVWHALDTSTAEIANATTVSKRASVDSSVTGFFAHLAARAVNTTDSGERWTPHKCPKNTCAVRFSPFGESCALATAKSGEAPTVRWRLESHARRKAVALIAAVAYLGADRLSEATSLHYGVGVATGVAACALVFLLLALHVLGSRASFRSRRVSVATLAALTLGYAGLVQRYVLTGLTSLVTDWPVACGVYVVVSAGASVAGTRAVLRTGLVPDFVRTGARVAALLLVLNAASPSAVATLVFFAALVLSDYLAEALWLLDKARSLVFSGLVAAASVSAVVLASRWLLGPTLAALRRANDFLSEAPKNTAVPLTVAVVLATAACVVVAVVVFASHGGAPCCLLWPPRRTPASPPPNFLHGHRFLTEAEYEQQGKRETERALAALTRDPQYAQWLAQNHHRLAAPSPTKFDHPDDDI